MMINFETINANKELDSKPFSSIRRKWKKYRKRKKDIFSAPSALNKSTKDEQDQEETDFEYCSKASDDSDAYSLSEESEHEKGNLSFENILESCWIPNINNMICCDVCKFEIEGKWFRVPDTLPPSFFTSTRKGQNIDFCEKCAEECRYTNGTGKTLLNVIEKDTKLMRAIRLQECDLAFDCLERSRKGLI